MNVGTKQKGRGINFVSHLCYLTLIKFNYGNTRKKKKTNIVINLIPYKGVSVDRFVCLPMQFAAIDGISGNLQE